MTARSEAEEFQTCPFREHSAICCSCRRVVYELVKEKIEKKFVVPEHVKDKVWNEIEIDQSGLVLNERRPHFHNPEIITKLPIFKIKYNSEKKNWSVYWMPSDGKWHLLEHRIKLDDILAYIAKNPEYFWG